MVGGFSAVIVVDSLFDLAFSSEILVAASGELVVCFFLPIKKK